MKIIEVNNVTKSYQDIEKLVIFNDANLSINEGEFVSLVAPSGNGKSTLIHLIAGLDSVDSGEITVDNHKITNLSESDLARLRRENIGLVFQFFNLFPSLKVIENVMLPMELCNMKQKEAKKKAEIILKRVGLQDKINKFPNQLSGGEQQRVSFARAFTDITKVVLADEPTGNLDQKNAQNLFALMSDLNKETNTTLLVVTHDLDLAKTYSDRLITIEKQKLVEL